MLSSPKESDYVRGTVTAVDIVRSVCKVRTEDGRFLTNVGWKHNYGGLGRSGENAAPVPREIVYVKQVDLNTFCIEGSPRINSYDIEDKLFIGSYQSEDDDFYRHYNLSFVRDKTEAGTSRPKDQIPGDRTITQGGGILGVTGSGSIIAKASALANIFITKIDDVVRVMSRNYEQFSEAAKKIQANVIGRVYEYHAWYYLRNSSRVDSPEYWEARGDVSAAEDAKGNYIGKSSLPSQDGTVRKSVVDEVDDGSIVARRYWETMSLDGEEIRKSNDTDDTNKTKEEFLNDKWTMYVDDGNGTGYKELNAAECIIDMQGSGSSYVKFDRDGNMRMVSTTSLYVETPDVDVVCDYATLDVSEDADATIGNNMTVDVGNDLTATVGNNASATVTNELSASAKTISAEATTSATLTSPITTVDSSTKVSVISPVAEFSTLVKTPAIAIGPLSGAPVVSGDSDGLSFTGGKIEMDSSSSMESEGNITLTNADVSADGTSLKGHIHTDSTGSNTTVPNSATP